MHGLPAFKGHQAGANTVRDITIFCAQKGVKFLTLYAFSTENWKRSKSEVDFLMKLLARYLQSERKTYMQNNIRFKAIGDLSSFSHALQETILKLQEDTAQNTALTQSLALNYGSRDELCRAFTKVLESNAIEAYDLESAIERNLDTAGMPDVDLLVRTGGEIRLSNFLLWQSSYAELFFTKSFWPDFKASELKEIIEKFKEKNRRFGGF